MNFNSPLVEEIQKQVISIANERNNLKTRIAELNNDKENLASQLNENNKATV